MGKIGFVFFADDWGYTKGGINSFNFDFCNALGSLDKNSLDVYCICKNTVSQDQKKEAEFHNVNIISIHETDFDSCTFDGIDFNDLFKSLKKCSAVYSVGHDIITASQATEFRKKCNSNKIATKLVLFHHMDYEAYYGVCNSGERVKEKIDKQVDAFVKADYIFAVGPKLFKSIQDKKIDNGFHATINQLIPGMTKIVPIESIKNRIKVLQTGRIEVNNDSIKQYGATVEAFSRLYEEKQIEDGSNLILLGISNSNGENVERDIKRHASEKASRFINIIGLKYTSKRDDVLSLYRTSSIVTMPSLSEGFGLVALEAISAGTPLVVTKNSGVYEFLESLKLENYVLGIDVKGSFGGEINKEDVDEIYKALKEIVLNYRKYKHDSLELRKMLIDRNYTWERTAQEFLELLGVDEYLKYRFIFSVLPQAFDCFDHIKLLKAAKKSINKNLKVLKIKKLVDFTPFFNAVDVDTCKNQLKKVGNYRDNDIKNFITNSVCDFLFEIIDGLVKNTSSNQRFIDSLLEHDFDKKLSFDNKDLVMQDYVLDKETFSFNNTIKKHLFVKLFDEDECKIIKEINKKQNNNYQNVDLKGLSKSVSNEEATLIPLNKIYAEVAIKGRKQSGNEYTVGKDFAKKLVEFNKTVVLGDPGTGKSTMFQKIILELCSESNDYKLCCIPIRISDLSMELSDGNIDLDNYIIKKFFGSKKSNKALYEKLKKYGYLFFLLDGYDETRNDIEKEKINNSIIKLLEESPNSYYFATSRIVGYNNFFENNNFSSFEIMPLSKKSIESFVDNWFNVVSFGEEDEAIKNKRKGERLKKLLSADSTLLELSKNPLLLTIIVILQYHGVTPPTDKGKLYEVIVETLLQSWIERKGSLIKDYKIDFLIGLFSEIAYKMVEDNYSTLMIDENSLRQVCLSYLASHSFDFTNNDSYGAVNTFIKYVSESVGILLKRGEYNGLSCYSFLIHRQFTEYFAAIKMESKNEDDDFKLEDYISEPKWVEVLILMFSFMNNQQIGGQKRANKVIDRLLKIDSASAAYIDDLSYNYQTLLKVMSNNVTIFDSNKKLVQEFIIKLFNTSHKYRFKQFISELLMLFASNYKDMVAGILINDIDYHNMQAFENVLLFLSKLFEQYPDKEIKVLIDNIDKKNNIFVGFYETFVLHNQDDDFLERNIVLRAFVSNNFTRFFDIFEKYDYKEIDYGRVLRFFYYYSPSIRTRGVDISLEKAIQNIKDITAKIKNDKIRSDLNRVLLLCHLAHGPMFDFGAKQANYILDALPECCDVVEKTKEICDLFMDTGNVSILSLFKGEVFIFVSEKQCTIKIITIKGDAIIDSTIVFNRDSNVDYVFNSLSEKQIDASYFLKAICSSLAYHSNYRVMSRSIQDWFLKKGVVVNNGYMQNNLDLEHLDDNQLIKNYDELFIGYRSRKMYKKSGTIFSSIICKLLINSSSSLTGKEKKYIEKMYETFKNSNDSNSAVYYDLINKIYNPFNAK